MTDETQVAHVAELVRLIGAARAVVSGDKRKFPGTNETVDL